MIKVKTVKTGVGSRIIQLIKAGGKSNKEILEIVRAENPARNTTYACIAWYQTKLKKEIVNPVANMSLTELLG